MNADKRAQTIIAITRLLLTDRDLDTAPPAIRAQLHGIAATPAALMHMHDNDLGELHQVLIHEIDAREYTPEQIAQFTAAAKRATPQGRKHAGRAVLNRTVQGTPDTTSATADRAPSWRDHYGHKIDRAQERQRAEDRANIGTWTGETHRADFEPCPF